MVKKTRRVSAGKLKKARKSRVSKDGSKTTTKEGGSSKTSKKVENVSSDEPGYMKQTISSKNK